MDDLDKPYRCVADKNVFGHVIGVVRVRYGVRKLYLYKPDKTGFSAVLCGYGEVFCPYCGRSREWHPDHDAMADLLEARKSRFSSGMIHSG